MLILIDESGDCGMANRDSAKYFTLAAVLFEDMAAAQACDNAIDQFRIDKELNRGFVFHFTSISASKRKAFLEAVRGHEFFYVTLTIDKRRLSGRSWKDKAFFYHEACRKLVSLLEDYMQVIYLSTSVPGKALIDNNEDPVYLDAIRGQLRRPRAENGQSLIKKAAPQHTWTSNLLQLVDMVCGAVVHSQNDGLHDLKKLVQHRCYGEVIWP